MNAPVVNQFELFYWHAYLALVSCRTFSEGAIPWTAILQYAEVYDALDMFDVFEQIINKLDTLVMNDQMKKRKTTKPKNKRVKGGSDGDDD